MRQRLGIAAAIMGKPDIILLDEPINAIDAEGVSVIRDAIRALMDDERIIIIACHDKEEMEYMADTVLHMSEDGWRRKHDMRLLHFLEYDISED